MKVCESCVCHVTSEDFTSLDLLIGTLTMPKIVSPAQIPLLNSRLIYPIVITTSWLRSLTDISNSTCAKCNLQSNRSLKILKASSIPLSLLYVTSNLPENPTSSTCKIIQKLTASHHLCWWNSREASIMPSCDCYRNLSVVLFPSLLPYCLFTTR